MIARAMVLAAAVVLPASLWAQDDYRYGYIRTVEPGVTLQRASEAASEAAVSNLPFLPGDRVWSDESGRLEVQFADGSVLRLDSRSKLDYVSQEGGRRAERVVLRLWSGALFLHYRDGRRSPEITIETAEGVLEPSERGVYRLDVEPGEARVAVLDGEATVDAGRRVRVGRGEGVVVREGELAEGPGRIDAYLADDAFARWDGDLEQQLAYADGRREEWLPEEVSPYAGDFGSYGTWRSEPEYGYVWYPRVAAGWRPYSQGYWAWTPYGWTWVPNERWGWAAFHYGRWGFSDLGWYWIPGPAWGPAWVSWSIGSDYVGWCPLGWGDRPVYVRWRDRGFAVRRRTGVAEGSVPWMYVRKGDIGQRDLARRKVAVSEVPTGALRVAPVGHARLTRDLRLVEGPQGAPAGAVPRTVRTKPTIGDTVPELRTNPMTTIPRAIPRTHRDPDDADDRNAGGNEGRKVIAPGAPRSPGSTPVPWSPDAQARPQRAPEAGSGHWSDRNRTGRDAQRARPEDDDAARARDRERGDRDREIMRPIFGPLSRPRPDDRGDDRGSARERDGDKGSARGRDNGAGASNAPRSAPPPPANPPSSRGSSKGGGERARPKDHN